MSGRSSQGWSNEKWLSDLGGTGADAVAAHEALCALLNEGLRYALRDRPEALSWVEDFTQESAVRVLQDLHQFRGDSRFTSWALSIAIRIAFDELRRARWRDVSLENLLDAGDAHHPSTLQYRDADLDRQRVYTVLHDAIETQLTMRQRTALLAELKEMPQMEIARQLGVTRNALYKLTHDARKSLKRGLSEAGITMETVRWVFSSAGERNETR